MGDWKKRNHRDGEGYDFVVNRMIELRVRTMLVPLDDDHQTKKWYWYGLGKNTCHSPVDTPGEAKRRAKAYYDKHLRQAMDAVTCPACKGGGRVDLNGDIDAKVTCDVCKGKFRIPRKLAETFDSRSWYGETPAQTIARCGPVPAKAPE